MATTDTINGTIEITNTCFNWCKEQFFIHNNNLLIGEMSLIGVAMGSIVLNRFINNHPDFIEKIGKDNNFEVTHTMLMVAEGATSFFAFVMLLIFLIYFIYFK